MILIKKLWVALSISVFAAMALTPAIVAAQTYTTGNASPTYTTGNASPKYTAGNSSPNYTSGNSVGSLSNPLGKVTGICQLLKIVLNVAILTGVPIGMFFIVFAGFKLIMARGNSEALIRARNNLMWTFIGLAIFLGVWFFVNLLANTLGALGVQILGDCR